MGIFSKTAKPGLKAAKPGLKAVGPVPSPALEVTEDPVTQRFERPGSFREVLTASEMHLGTRAVQQDACYVTSATSFWDGESHLNTIGIVCDGMGGLEHGAEASKMVIDQILADIAAAGQVEDPASFFKNELGKLDDLVVQRFGANNAGTTLVLAVLSGSRLYWCSAGDSRLYLIRQDEIVQLTRDHNYFLLLKEQVENQDMTIEEAEQHPQKEALVSFLGMGGIEIFDINNSPFQMVNGDVVLLCSDGLTKSLTADQIRDVIRQNYGQVDQTARLLPVVAFDTGGAKDNTSVVVIQYFE